MDWLDSTVFHILAILVSAVLLWKGADGMVDALARIARRLNISELVIGLTVVAFATSAPELAVSIGAALKGQADISVGNIVGSNIFNLGIIMGGVAAIRPIVTSRVLVYRDGIFLIAITVVLAAFITDLSLSRWEGIALVCLLFSYIGFLFWKKTPLEGDDGDDAPADARGKMDYVIVVVGLLAILGGAQALVFGASGLARSMGVSDWVIAVTIVAAGTSAPEVVTALSAVLKGKHGMSAGGLIGSDLYNLLGVLGVAAIIRPLDVADAARPSVYVLVGFVTVVIFFMRTGWKVSRAEGMALLLFNVGRWYFDITGKG